MRVIVLDQSESLRQVVEFITERGVDVELVAETDALVNLKPLLEKTQADYLFLLQREYDQLTEEVTRIFADYPALGIALVSEEEQEVHLQVSGEAGTQGLTGREQQENGSTAIEEGPFIPHSPNEENREQTNANAGATPQEHDTPAVVSSPKWRTYTLSDFIYLMTADQPTTPPGGITDVPHDSDP
jgi:hypothetical protein